MIYSEMTQTQRKDWAFANLERDFHNPGSEGRNITRHGAHRIVAIFGPCTWPNTYGQSPFDDTFSAAYDIVHSRAA